MLAASQSSAYLLTKIAGMSESPADGAFGASWRANAPALVAQLSSDLDGAAVCVDHRNFLPCQQCLYGQTATTTYSEDPQAIALVLGSRWSEPSVGAYGPSPLPGAHAQPLSPLEQARWDAMRAAIGDIAEAVMSPELTEEQRAAAARAWEQMLKQPFDRDTLSEALHVPSDAGEFAPALERILRRIPDRWDRWIRCERGWYPLIVRVDDSVSELLPHYEVHQVKEKFGELCYYWSLSQRPMPCCAWFTLTNPRPKAAGDWGQAEATPGIRAWNDQFGAHKTSPEHLEHSAVRDARIRALAPKIDAAKALVKAAEEESTRTCQLCGRTGTLRLDGRWYRTMCYWCAKDRGLTT